MTDETTGHVGSPDEGEPSGPVIRDKRRIDPATGEVRQPAPEPTEPTASDDRETPMSDPSDQHKPGDQQDGMPQDPFSAEESAVHDAQVSAAEADAAAERAKADGEHPDTVLAAERLADLQRLQAEYVNYKRRVDRDKVLLKDLGASSVIEALMPVLDEIALARQHGDLGEGTPFASIADKLQQALGRFGLEAYGEVGDEFDPALHEALMHVEAELPEGATTTTVVQVLQPGYRQGDRVLRAARVSVADPQ